MVGFYLFFAVFSIKGSKERKLEQKLVFILVMKDLLRQGVEDTFFYVFFTHVKLAKFSSVIFESVYSTAAVSGSSQKSSLSISKS
jgi:hypothetical protein